VGVRVAGGMKVGEGTLVIVGGGGVGAVLPTVGVLVGEGAIVVAIMGVLVGEGAIVVARVGVLVGVRVSVQAGVEVLEGTVRMATVLLGLADTAIGGVRLSSASGTGEGVGDGVCAKPGVADCSDQKSPGTSAMDGGLPE